eukprot:g5947.t1
MDSLSPAEARALRAMFESYLLGQVRVTIDGEAAAPRLENVQLNLTPDPQLVVLYPKMGMRALMRCSAVIVYESDAMPEHVELTWPGYPVDQLAAEIEPGSEVRMVLEGQVRAEGVVELVRYSEADPTVEWSAGGIAARFLPTPAAPDAVGGARVGSVSLGLAGVTLLCGVWLVVSLVRAKGRALPLVALVVSAGAGYAARGVAPIDAPWGGGGVELPGREFCERVFRPLHLNMYRSFDYTDESDVYDALAGSVEGPLLEALYTQIYASLVQGEQGGMLGIITGIEPMELAIDDIRLGAVDGADAIVFSATHRWRVEGTVYHWGHSHTRTIEYLARYEVAGLDQGWRFVGHEVLEQTRLDPGEQEPADPNDGLRYTYPTGGRDRFSLKLDGIEIAPGQDTACIGPSGCGKSTLLRLLTGILVPDRGSVTLAGEAISAASESRRRALRVSRVGMVFQQFALLEYLSAMDNILVPYRVSGALRLDREVRDRARSLAGELGIGALLKRKPARLSQGERQRVAVCRALVTRPGLIVCDEPTGNLDPARSRATVELIVREARASGATVLLVTHDHGLLDGFAQGSRFDLVFSSLYFRAGQAGTIPMSVYESLADNPGLETLPLHVRFTARGAPVVATDIGYLQRRGLRVGDGRVFAAMGEAVLGAGAARRLGLAPGDALSSDQLQAYDLTSPASIRMRVVGVLAPGGAIDDGAVFVDLQTAWLLEGIAHGHRDAREIDRPDLLIGRTDDYVALSGAVVTEQDVTGGDAGDFHIHGDRADLPLTAVLVYPDSEKASTILRTAINASPGSQAVEPTRVIDELMAFVVRVRMVFDALAIVLGVSTLALIGLISALSYRVREDEIRTLTEIGCARSSVARLFGYELGVILALGAALAAGLAWGVQCPLPASEDPIFWAPGPEVIAAYQRARLVIVNGAELEKWVATAPLPRARVVDAGADLGVELITIKGATHSHGPAGEHSHDGIDGHTWVDPLLAAEQTGAIAAAMARAFPEHADAFETNRDALVQELRLLDAQLGGLETDGVSLIASHPAYNYLSRRHGWGIESLDLDPGAALLDADLDSITGLVRPGTRGVVLWESAPRPASVERLDGAGVRSVVFSPAENPGEGEGDYLEIMRGNIDRLRDALDD